METSEAVSYQNELISSPRFKLVVAEWRHMATWIEVNTGSGNGLLPDGIKPLHEPMLTNDEWGIVAFTW